MGSEVCIFDKFMETSWNFKCSVALIADQLECQAVRAGRRNGEFPKPSLLQEASSIGGCEFESLP